MLQRHVNGRPKRLSRRPASLDHRLAKYIRDFDNWALGDDDRFSEIYEPNPMFVITAVTDNDAQENFKNLAYDFEWNRGEVEASLPEGNYAYQRQIQFMNTILRRIHMVSFDNGKKTVVAPDWVAIGKGRFYYYLKDSINYAYQCFNVADEGEDHSQGLSKRNSAGYFDIPVLDDQDELTRFVEFCGIERHHTPETDKEEQNKLFYQLLDKFDEFKRKEV